MAITMKDAQFLRDEVKPAVRNRLVKVEATTDALLNSAVDFRGKLLALEETAAVLAEELKSLRAAKGKKS